MDETKAKVLTDLLIRAQSVLNSAYGNMIGRNDGEIVAADRVISRLIADITEALAEP